MWLLLWLWGAGVHAIQTHTYLKVSREHSTGSQAVESTLVLIILINYLPHVAAECIVWVLQL